MIERLLSPLIYTIMFVGLIILIIIDESRDLWKNIAKKRSGSNSKGGGDDGEPTEKSVGQ